MFKGIFILFLIFFATSSSSAQILDTTSFQTRDGLIKINVTQADVEEYRQFKNLADTAMSLPDILMILKTAKTILVQNPKLSYNEAVRFGENGLNFYSRFNPIIEPKDLEKYLIFKKIGDTTGRGKELEFIVRNLKFRMQIDTSVSYEKAASTAEDFYIKRHMVDKVLVIKSERKMYLQKNGKTVRSYSIALGPNPVGQKEREGDGRTPEGTYLIDWQKYKNPNYHSFHLNYPNEKDLARAKTKGLNAGSNIMIHGTTPGVKKKKDWTNGCIALNNKDMSEFHQIVFLQTPVEIRK